MSPYQYLLSWLFVLILALGLSTPKNKKFYQGWAYCLNQRTPMPTPSCRCSQTLKLASGAAEGSTTE